MKTTVWLIISLSIVPALVWAVPNTPSDLTLTPDSSSITMSWTANSENVDSYTIYKGTSQDNLAFVGSTTNTTFVISGLASNTTYYIGLSATDSTGESTQNISSTSTTAEDVTAPEAPSNFRVSSPEAVTESTVPLTWDLNSESDIAYYEIRYGTTSGNYSSNTQTASEDISALTISGLEASTRYYFSIIAVDDAGNESDNADELIVDTLVDTLAPYTPSIVSVELSDIGTLSVSFDGTINSGMADLAGYRIYYGTESQTYGDPIEIDADQTSYSLDGLEDNLTYYFAMTAIDASGNESALSDEKSASIEGTKILLSDDTIFEGGCFMNSLDAKQNRLFTPLSAGLAMLALLLTGWTGRRWLSHIKTIPWRPTLLTLFLLLICSSAQALDQKPPKNNLIGATFGYCWPSDKLQKDIYQRHNVYKIFYERRFLKFMGVDISTGFGKKKGHALTVSGQETKIATKLKIIPTSASLTFNYSFTPYICAYVGGGLDYWYFMEQSAAYHEEIKEGVGGYHAKWGLKLLTEDPNFDGFGVILEGSYSSIDRFEKNKLDLGGFNFDFGLIYMF